jgi:hypothetical protein
MSFRVYVTIPHEIKELPVDDTQHDLWLENENKYVTYDEPIASDSEFYNYWLEPAKKLSLTLLSKIYENGIVLHNQNELTELELEVNLLREYWLKNILEEDFEGNVRTARLEERIIILKSAILKARKDNEILSIC